MKQPAPSRAMDFLSRMVSRARGLESPIAPRLRSLFEPAFAAPVPSPTEMETVASPIAAREPSDAQPAPTEHPGPAMQGPRPLILDSIEIAQRCNTPEPRENGLPALERQAAPVAPRIVTISAPRQGAQVALSRPEPGVKARADRSAHAALGQFDISNQEQSALLPSPTPAMRQGETELRKPLESKGASPKARSGELSVDAGALLPELAVMRMSPTVFPQAPVASRSPGQGHQPARASQEQAAPVINVTIGRVEVRAVQATAARPRGEPAKPKALSLEEYLKQRGRR